MKRILLFALLVMVAAKLMLTTTGCANIIPPDGGPRDSLPPILTSINPGDSSRNFSGTRISFSFDEFIDVTSWRENVIMSPGGINMDITTRLNTLTVKFNEPLEPNTTYSINFGNAVKDFNEGNVYKNLVYTFSTGPYIDSLELSGKVLLAETGKIDTNMIVILHTSADDSALRKSNPRYITKLDGRGNFNFRNLPPRLFYVYALREEGGLPRYQNERQLFAFADKPILVTDSVSPLTMYAYSVNPQAASTSLQGIAVGGRRNTGADNRLRYQVNILNNEFDLLSEFVMTFDQPLRLFDSTKIRLYTDSLFVPAPGYRFQKDSTNRRVLLSHEWKENTNYHIILDKEFAKDSAGRQLLKTDTLSFKTKKLTEYGSLKIKFRNLDMAKNPVLLFVSGETILRSFPLNNNEFSAAVFTAGEYELRILYDQNKNGRWDPGEFFGKRKQPELGKTIDRKITVRAAWQNEFDIEVPR